MSLAARAPRAMADAAPFALDEVTVDYPGVRALDRVSFAAEAGEVHALLGENGAGKSTLLKVLAGIQSPTSGTLNIGGQRASFRSPADALAAGVAVIHQELHLAPELSVGENLLMGQLPARGGFLARAAMLERARAILAELGEPIDPRARVGALPIGQRQMVEIGKALLRDARVIAFDEPTSSLSSRETVALKRIVGELRARGVAVIYVTHRMEEVYALADTATVLRDGAVVARYAELKDIDPDRLIEAMVGRRVEDVYSHRARTAGEMLFEADALTGPGLSAPVKFGVRAGEILGLFGLVGAGRTELARLIAGAERATGGTMRLGDKPYAPMSPRAAIRAGVALAPEDRKGQAIFPLASVSDNINISARRRSARGVIIARARETATARTFIDRLRIRTPGPGTPIGRLSGGNQQKAVLARWLAEEVDLLIVDEPTRGIDVGARAEIYAILYGLAQQGKAIIMISSDLPEVMGVSDRIGIMREGRLVRFVNREDARAEALLALALPR